MNSPAPLLQLTRPIPAPRPQPLVSGVTIRPSAVAADVASWLEIQNEVLNARGAPPAWGPQAFDRELSSRPWWRPDCLLLAHLDPLPRVVGCLAIEIVPPRPWAQLHWLAVRPDLRRRGIARCLITAADQQAQAAGCRELRAETLRSWPEATQFYQALGFSE